MKVLTINTYGGSLLLGATALGCEVIGSYEDTGFGLPIQQANFPGLDFRATRADWPEQDLSDVVVIAHPPCSAFSVQTRADKKGVNSSAFACTKQVLQYAVDNKALAIAVESVVGALAGAWAVHQHYAEAYGYHVYRVLQNGSMFGAQWRDRFWVLYVKAGAAPLDLPLTLLPRWRSVGEVVDGHTDGPSPAGMDTILDKMKRRFVEQAGCTAEEIWEIFDVNPSGKYISVDKRLWRRKFPTHDPWETCKAYVSKYATSVPVILAPDYTCPVLLGGSWWLLNGRNLSENAYKALMGFPVDYIFPERGKYRQDMRTYLSKGVMPPVAQWILEQLTLHLGWTGQARRSLDHQVEGGPIPYTMSCAPNSISDFRIHRKEWGMKNPRLRAEDDRAPEPRAGEPLEFECSLCSTPAGPSPICPSCGGPTVLAAGSTFTPPPTRRARGPRAEYPRTRSSRTQWNSAELEEALSQTLFTRPNTADKYALHESHGYHRMGVKAGDVILDIGAHIGCVASRAALIGASVLSIEAEPQNYELLCKNVQAYPRVRTLWAAVYGGDQPTVKLNRVARRNDGGWSTGTHSVQFKTQGDTIDVPRADFRLLLRQERPTVIKCDIEGSEFSMDWTNLPPTVRAIGIELHHRGGKLRAEAKALVAVLYAQRFKPVHDLNMESSFSAIIAFLARDNRPCDCGGTDESCATCGGSGTAPLVVDQPDPVLVADPVTGNEVPFERVTE